MANARVGVGFVVGCLLLGGAGPAWAAPSVAQMLAYRPKQEGVNCSTPTPAEHAVCEVRLVGGSVPGSSGWLLLDQKKQPLRRFFDTDGDKKIDIWSYYKDGVEVYRETDTKGTGRPNEFRWLNAGGMKWGVDLDGDGKIDAWRMISAEEAAQEVLQATVARDFARLQTLFLTEADLRTLRLPAAQVDRIREQLKQAPTRFQAVAAKMSPLSDKTVPRIDGAVPQCVPAASSAEQDLFKVNATVLFETADKSADKTSGMLQTGEMLQVGLAWKLADGPSLGGIDPPVDATLQKLMEMLAELDKTPPPALPAPAPSTLIEEYNLKRVEVIEKILGRVPAAEQELWLKQLADNLSTAALHAQKENKSSFQKLQSLKDQKVQAVPGSSLAGYLTFRVLWTEYSPKISNQGPDLAKIQTEWLEKLAGFVQSYPHADDTPDALLHLGMGSEFAGKEDEAKRWYQQLASNFPEHPMAPKAKGAATRLDLVGKTMELAGKTATGGDFDVSSLKGKVIAVYYWAKYCRDIDRETATLKDLHGKLNAKGFELVTVSLDDQPDAAMGYLQKAALPGMHLIQPASDGGGMNGPLATQYGIMGLPNLFLVGKDGKVISRTVTVNDLETAVQKAL